MRSRCTNPNVDSFPLYGGRGFRVCERWRSYAGFLADMGECPPGMTLERVDPNGNYEPGNVRWATPREQANNRRSNRVLEHNGERHTAADWARRLGMRPQTLIQRLRYGWSVARALTEPVISPKRGSHA